MFGCMCVRCKLTTEAHQNGENEGDQEKPTAYATTARDNSDRYKTKTKGVIKRYAWFRGFYGSITNGLQNETTSGCAHISHLTQGVFPNVNERLLKGGQLLCDLLGRAVEHHNGRVGEREPKIGGNMKQWPPVRSTRRIHRTESSG